MKFDRQVRGRALRNPIAPDATFPKEWTLEHRTDRAKPPLFIDVITAGLDPDAPPEQTHRINYNRPQSRDWLTQHIAWALNTGRTVHLAKVDQTG